MRSKKIYITGNLTIQLRRVIQQKEKGERGVKWREKNTEFFSSSSSPLLLLWPDCREVRKKKKKEKKRERERSHLSEESPAWSNTTTVDLASFFFSLPLARARAGWSSPLLRVVSVNFVRGWSRPSRLEVLGSFRL